MNIPALTSIIIIGILLALIPGCTSVQEESYQTPGYIVSDTTSAPVVELSEGMRLYRLINPAYTDIKGNDIIFDLSYIVAEPDSETGYHMLKSTSEGLFIVSGFAEFSANGSIVNANTGDFVLLPADTLINVKNSGDGDLLMYSVCEPYYGPDTEIDFKIDMTGENAFSGGQEIFKKNIDNIEPDYFRNIFYFKQIITPDEIGGTIFDGQISYDLGYVVIPPGECSTVHRLAASGETIAILSGTGMVNIDKDVVDISKGEVVYIPVDSVQAIINNGKEDLIYFSIVQPAWTMDNDILINLDCSIVETK